MFQRVLLDFVLKTFGLGAENETRTRDPNLGKVVLYQLSYFRSMFRNCECKGKQNFSFSKFFRENIVKSSANACNPTPPAALLQKKRTQSIDFLCYLQYNAYLCRLKCLTIISDALRKRG